MMLVLVLVLPLLLLLLVVVVVIGRQWCHQLRRLLLRRDRRRAGQAKGHLRVVVAQGARQVMLLLGLLLSVRLRVLVVKHWRRRRHLVSSIHLVVYRDRQLLVLLVLLVLVLVLVLLVLVLLVLLHVISRRAPRHHHCRVLRRHHHHRHHRMLLMLLVAWVMRRRRQWRHEDMVHRMPHTSRQLRRWGHVQRQGGGDTRRRLRGREEG